MKRLLLFCPVLLASLCAVALWITPQVSESAEGKPARKVAVLVFDGVELLDFAGPAEVFIVAAYGKAYEVYTVADTKSSIRTMGGVTIQPAFSLDDAPQPDVLIVPGGGMSTVSKRTLQWLRKAAGKAEVSMSVCMGAFLLARVGLLDGKEATTHHWGFDSLQSAAPRCKVVRDRRVVDSGKIVTTAGVSAGIDGALHIVERLDGREAARWIADEWMEYPRLDPKRPEKQITK